MRIGRHNYIKQLRLRNEDALMYVIDEYGGLLMAVIRKHLFGLPERQEECFDDVLLKIWRNSLEFDEEKNSFANWAAAIARYQAIAREDLVLEKMIEEEISRETEKMLSCLKPQDRELFMKVYVDEQPIEQVSKETGMKKAVIYNRLSRGKAKIRRQCRMGNTLASLDAGKRAQ